IIHANDSHYIYPEESKYRTKFLKAKGINYPEEDGFILDYPNSDDIFKRYEKQNVLTKQEIEIALKNTLIFDECEEVTLINEDIKLPSISKNPNKELKEILNKEWLEKRKNIPENRWNEYLDAIRYEFDIIEKTHMEDYFIIDYKIVQRAKQEYNGLLTKTGRGSAPSFIITNLLGLTEIDRLNAPVPLFPTRFMSVERILSA
ncbi:DNA polymerase III subunit alpha, partial [Clostridioides sp. ES-S-0049-03]|nr:DNA polymerase III subunit alpha [Clostridioides sp. ES-S-0049-03]